MSKDKSNFTVQCSVKRPILLRLRVLFNRVAIAASFVGAGAVAVGCILRLFSGLDGFNWSSPVALAACWGAWMAALSDLDVIRNQRI